MKLGSAFQKVNFLRDLKADKEDLNRTYFPNTKFEKLSESEKNEIINDIEDDFKMGLEGIKELPLDAKFGVFMAYRYYNQLLKKLKKTPATEIINRRIRVPNLKKIGLLTDKVMPLYEKLNLTSYIESESDFEIDWAELNKPLETTEEIDQQSEKELAAHTAQGLF